MCVHVYTPVYYNGTPLCTYYNGTALCSGFGYEYFGGGGRGRVDDHGEL